MDSEFAFLGVICVAMGLFFGGVYIGSGGKEDGSKARQELAELTSKYEGLQCSHRGLDLTTVKGITLCMNRDTKALHKIDEKAD